MAERESNFFFFSENKIYAIVLIFVIIARNYTFQLSASSTPFMNTKWQQDLGVAQPERREEDEKY